MLVWIHWKIIAKSWNVVEEEEYVRCASQRMTGLVMSHMGFV